MTSAPGAATGLSLLAALSWGAGDFSGGFATRRASPFLVVSVAHGFSLLLLLLFHSHAGPANLELARLGIFAGIAGGVALIAFYQALSLGEMGVTAALGGVLSAAIPVGFAMLTQGSPKPLQLAGFAVAAVAIWLIAYAPGSQAHVRGLLLATLAGLGFGIFLILLKRTGSESLYWAVTFSRAASTAVALLLLLMTSLRRKPESPLLSAGWKPALLVAALAGLFDTGGNFLYTWASTFGRLDVTAVLSSMYPAVTMLLAVVLLRERTSRLQAAGIGLALAAVSLISFA